MPSYRRAAILNGRQVHICALELKFIGGSMGTVVGEVITRAIERSIEHNIPLIIVSASGGARMQEGAVSLMQLGKISAALMRLDDAKVPYISVLTDPTTGGVTASFAMLGDLNIAEPGALIGFAGPRVIEQTIRQKLPDGFQTSEFLLQHGFLDGVVKRADLKDYLAPRAGFLPGMTFSSPNNTRPRCWTPSITSIPRGWIRPSNGSARRASFPRHLRLRQWRQRFHSVAFYLRYGERRQLQSRVALSHHVAGRFAAYADRIFQ